MARHIDAALALAAPELEGELSVLSALGWLDAEHVSKLLAGAAEGQGSGRGSRFRRDSTRGVTSEVPGNPAWCSEGWFWAGR